MSSIVIQDWFRDDLYALVNSTITNEQSIALSKSIHHIKAEIQEICFANNNLSDKQFADLLDHIQLDSRLYNNLKRITYGSNNEFGHKTLASLDRFFKNKKAQFPLTHLALVNCKQRIRTVDPLLKTISSTENRLETLIIP